MIMYSIRDMKTGFGEPVCFANRGQAIRQFQYIFSENKLWNFAPEDIELWEVGEFDEEHGIIKAKEPSYVMGGKDING